MPRRNRSRADRNRPALTRSQIADKSKIGQPFRDYCHGLGGVPEPLPLEKRKRSS
jgi:hypothetical protein